MSSGLASGSCRSANRPPSIAIYWVKSSVARNTGSFENVLFWAVYAVGTPSLLYSPWKRDGVTRVNEEMKMMNVDMNAMKAEVGGAFVVSWAVFGSADMIAAGELASLAGALALAVVWMAFSGAHVLPVITWCHMLNDGDGDVEGNYMPNGMRLVAQVVGALLAVVLITEAGGWDGPDYAAADFAVPETWALLGTIAAGAVWWQVHTRCESAWASAFGLMVLGGAMVLDGGHEMGSMLADGVGSAADVLPAWIVDGLLVGLGARLGSEIDNAL